MFLLSTWPYQLNNDRKVARRGRGLNWLQAGLTVSPKAAPIDLGVVKSFWLEATGASHTVGCAGNV